MRGGAWRGFAPLIAAARLAQAAIAGTRPGHDPGHDPLRLWAHADPSATPPWPHASTQTLRSSCVIASFVIPHSRATGMVASWHCHWYLTGARLCIEVPHIVIDEFDWMCGVREDSTE